MIVVGLGCVGISACYNLAKNGLKVLGLEKYSDTGSIGTGSYGFTRIWRHGHNWLQGKEMMSEALEMWREIEQKTEKKLLLNTGFLWIQDPSI